MSASHLTEDQRRHYDEQGFRLVPVLFEGDVRNPKLLHGSGRNRSGGYGRAISAHFASSTCQYLQGMAPIDGGRPYVLVQGRESEGCI